MHGKGCRACNFANLLFDKGKLMKNICKFAVRAFCSKSHRNFIRFELIKFADYSISLPRAHTSFVMLKTERQSKKRMSLKKAQIFCVSFVCECIDSSNEK